MYRKAIEVSQMCNLDIFILTLDRDTGKLVEYNSIRPDGIAFTSQLAWKELIKMGEAGYLTGVTASHSADMSNIGQYQNTVSPDFR